MSAPTAVLDEPVEPAVPTTRRRPNRALQVALFLVPVVIIVIVGWSRRWLEEDAFLNFRVVDQIRAGHGPVFNVGERVETTTSTLWLVLLLVGRTIFPFVKIEYVSIVGGLLFTGLGLWWAQCGASELWRDRESLFLPFGALLFVALPAQWDWATGGLENGLSVGWLGGLMFVVARLSRPDPDRRRRPVPIGPVKLALAGVVLGLGPLVRPDLAIFSAAAIVAVLVARRPWGRDLACLLGGIVALPVFVEIFRMGYYGTLVPNTALAKDSSGAYWDEGWKYFHNFVDPYWLWVPAVAVVLAIALGISRGRPRAPVVAMLALPIGGVLHGLYIVQSGGDYLHARLLLPTVFAILAPVAAIPWCWRMVAPILIAVCWGIAAAGFMRMTTPFQFRALTHGVIDGRPFMDFLSGPHRDPILATDFHLSEGPTAKKLQAAGKRDFVQDNLVLENATPERTTLLPLLAGISGYLAGPDVIVQESYGLGDAVISRLPPFENTNPAHRKGPVGDWVYALRLKPGVVVPYANNDRIAAARRALRCGALADLHDTISAPLDLSRFMSNLTGALDTTTLTIPRNPYRAERKFCGAKARGRPTVTTAIPTTTTVAPTSTTSSR